MAFYKIDKSELEKYELKFGEDKVIITCDCEDTGCSVLHVQSNEWEDDNEKFVYGIVMDLQHPPNQRFSLRLRNAWRMLLNKNTLWPDGIVFDCNTARLFAEWILEVIHCYESRVPYTVAKKAKDETK